MARASAFEGAALERIPIEIAECSSVAGLAAKLGVPFTSLRDSLQERGLPSTFHKLQQIYLTGAIAAGATATISPPETRAGTYPPEFLE